MNENKPATSNTVAKMEVSYTTLGQEIKLNANIVRNYLTKGNGNVTDQEILQFISICKYQQLNPFLNEAYLVKFANNRGGEDTAQIIVSKEAFMKRAEGCPEYEGFRAGLILKRGTELLYNEGEFMLDGDLLLGGWAEVYRADRKYPFKSFVNLKEYDKGRSTWNAIKCTMIRKVAITHALREAFPTQLGAMYTTDESMPIQDAEYEEVANDKEVSANANSIDLPEDTPAETMQPNPVQAKQEIPEIFK
ncbi:MAG: phage recombination protein Bet [Bacteroides sp.]|nr:phage recombination protein Bet [Bacteroidales bacterium]MCM1068695.1 phage recombination protein Bet [Prevotella sp.]MCM1354756.1 phage recombination protein Bet [Bacteroides sp.]MCM1443677.1 phage recombination protein Bet [Muribaculum sp.]MCM1403876.1 phage recombination protein Bet [Bacteroides sp.]